MDSGGRGGGHDFTFSVALACLHCDEQVGHLKTLNRVRTKPLKP